MEYCKVKGWKKKRKFNQRKNLVLKGIEVNIRSKRKSKRRSKRRSKRGGKSYVKTQICNHR